MTPLWLFQSGLKSGIERSENPKENEREHQERSVWKPLC